VNTQHFLLLWGHATVDGLLGPALRYSLQHEVIHWSKQSRCMKWSPLGQITPSLDLPLVMQIEHCI
jgi:hypothetical protein